MISPLTQNPLNELGYEEGFIITNLVNGLIIGLDTCFLLEDFHRYMWIYDPSLVDTGVCSMCIMKAVLLIFVFVYAWAMSSTGFADLCLIDGDGEYVCLVTLHNS